MLGSFSVLCSNVCNVLQGVKLRVSTLAVGGAIVLAGSSLYGGPGPFHKVAILSAANNNAYDQDIRTKLLSAGPFSIVDVIKVNTVTPTLSTLQQYGAVLVYAANGNTFLSSSNLGNVLKTYQETGYGVVNANATLYTSAELGGSWNNNYQVIARGTLPTATSSTLLAVGPPPPAGASDLLSGVSVLEAKEQRTNTAQGTVGAGAVVVARWADGAPLVAYKTVNSHPIVDLGFNPVSNSTFTGSWVGDGARLMANALLFSQGLPPTPAVNANLTITPITWDVIGLDSNNENSGPNTFVVGARVRNSGPDVAANVVANFTWSDPLDNGHINLIGPSTLTTASLAANESVDFYFNVDVLRNAGATSPANRARSYQISASAFGVTPVSTPLGRELYVEKLISQNRNRVTAFIGPTDVLVGNTYQYTLNSKTATAGYEQVESFVNFPNHIFQILSVNSTYSVGGFKDTLYYNACGWDPVSRMCVGPETSPTGKAGGTISTVYTVKILGATSTGPVTVTSMIYDFSGSSYHYNADYGTGINIKSVSAVEPATSGNVAGHVYNDLNNNGAKDGGETGASGVSVRIIDSTGGTGYLSTTDVNGNYTGLVNAGLVTVQVETSTLPAGKVVSTPATSPQVVTVPSGGNGSALQVGLYQAPGISSRLFLDENGNGIQDTDTDGAYTEFGIPDFTLTIDGNPVSTTDFYGDFKQAVSAGNHTVSLTLPANHYVTTGNVPQVVAASAGSVTATTPIGLQVKHSLVGNVYNDDNMNQARDGGESGAPSIGVNVTDAFGVLRSTTTNISGDYSILVPVTTASINLDNSTFGNRNVTTGNDPQEITIVDPSTPGGPWNVAQAVGLANNNSAPSAQNDGYNATTAVELAVPSPGVLVNDTDGNSDSLTADLETDVSNGTLVLNDDGSFTYTSNPGFTGSDSFTYYAFDGQTNSASVATVTINVTAVPAPPATPPTMVSAAYVSPTAITVTFSEPMGTGVLNPANFVISGPGAGTLSPSPASVTWVGGNTYQLTWNANAATPGQLLTVTVNPATVFDAAGEVMGTPHAASLLVPAAVNNCNCGA